MTINEEESYDEMSNDSSEYERMLHPNEGNGDDQKKIMTGCIKYLNRFDELIMKPIFIYKYERGYQKKSKEFFNIFMKQGN